MKEVENEGESILSQLFSDSESPKKKKDRNLTNLDDPSKIFDEFSMPKKKKKHKHSFDISEEFPIDTSLDKYKIDKIAKKNRNDFKADKKQKSKTENKSIDNRELEQFKKNKKHKKKDVFKLDTIITDPSPSRNRHDGVIANSTMFSPNIAPSLQLDESSILTVKKTKKHKHRVSIDTSFIDDIVKDVTLSREIVQPKKKKSKKDKKQFID